MNTRHRWITAAVALLLAAGIAFVAYNAGLANAVDVSAGQAHDHHHHHWGGGWAVPLFFFVVWLFAFRTFRGHHHPCRYDENHPRG